MFLKPFRIKSNTRCDDSDKRKLRCEIASTYSTLTREQVDSLIPDAKSVYIIRLVTYGGVVVTTYHINLEPMFFEHEEKLVPSVYTVWKYPNMLRKIVLDLPGLSRLKNGADLLLTSIKTNEKEGGLNLDGMQPKEYVSILSKTSNCESSGIGVSMMSLEEMKEAGMAGRGFRVLQTQGDLLWEMGSMMTPLRLSSAYRPSSDSKEKPAAVEPPSLPPLDIDDLPSKAHDSAPPSVNDHKRPLPPLLDSDHLLDFKIIAEAVMRTRQIAFSERKLAVLLALEERARELGCLPSSLSVDLPPLPLPPIFNPMLRSRHEAMGSLSANPSERLYREAQRLLDDGDDEVDEIGVSIPEDYRGMGEEGEEEVKKKEDEDEEVKLESCRTWQRVKKKKKAKEKERSKGELASSSSSDLELAGEKGKKGEKLPVKEYEDHLIKVEQKLRESGKDLSSVDSSLSSLLSEFRLNLLGGKRKESEDAHVDGEEDKDGEDCDDNDVDDAMAELPRAEDTMFEDPDESRDVTDEEEEEEEEEVVEEGVASSWYSISETPAGGASVGGVAKVDDQVQEMDDLMRDCFFLGIKAVKTASVTFPLLTSTLYRVYMVEACPTDLRLEVKKSSYKKLSKFLLIMQSQGVITLKENDKGADVITEIDYRHPLVKNFMPSIIRSNPEPGATGEADVKSIKITQLYMPGHRQVPMFRLLNYSKTSLLEYQQAREAIMKYVKDNDLANKDNMACVIPNPVLTDAMGPTGPSFMKGILRPDLIKLVIEHMRPAYSITYGKAPPIIRRGTLEPVKLTLAQRTGNKKVTLVDNLEVYGIPASDVAHSLQKIAAASTTVTDVPGHSSARQVLVQGNAIKTVTKLLEENYGLPIKHIEAINKIKPPKTTKKKKKRK